MLTKTSKTYSVLQVTVTQETTTAQQKCMFLIISKLQVDLFNGAQIFLLEILFYKKLKIKKTFKT